MIFLKKEILMILPPHCNIVIFDEGNSFYIKENILKGLPVFVYNMRPEKLYLHYKVVWSFFKSFKSFDIRKIPLNKLFFRKLIKELLNIYRLGTLRIIKPKVMISIVDNSPDLHWLCENYKEIEILVIQNGNRTRLQLDVDLKFTITNFFCFGNYERDLYNKYQKSVDFFYPVGSLLDNYYQHSNKSDHRIMYDICIVSNLRKSAFLEPKLKDLWESVEQTNLYLAKYLAKYKFRLVVLLRNEAGQDCGDSDYIGEVNYFKKFFKGDVYFSVRDNKKLKSYQIIRESSIILGFASTVVREAFGNNKKALYCDFTGTKKYHDYDDMIMMTDNSYVAFEDRLNKLMQEPYEEYVSRTKKYATYLMNNNSEIPLHLNLRQRIENAISDNTR